MASPDEHRSAASVCPRDSESFVRFLDGVAMRISGLHVLTKASAAGIDDESGDCLAAIGDLLAVLESDLVTASRILRESGVLLEMRYQGLKTTVLQLAASASPEAAVR